MRFDDLLDEVEFNVTEFSLDEYVNRLKKPFPVYGDFLQYFTIRIGDMPSNMTSWVIKLGLFYEELERIATNMVEAYVDFVFLHAGYVDFISLEIMKTLKEELTPETIRDDVLSGIKEVLEGEGENPSAEYEIFEYVNLRNRLEGIRVALLSLHPSITDDTVLFGFWGKSKEKALIENLSEPSNRFKKLSKLIIVDPLTYRLAREFINELKERLKVVAPEIMVLSTEELVKLLGLDKQEIEEKWSDLKEEAIEKLKEKYPFLAIYPEIWKIRQAQKDIKNAIAELSKTELKEDEYRAIIWRVSNAIEAYLSVLYHNWKKKPSEEKTLGWLLNSLKNEIEEEFGEDIWNDLKFINKKRILVDHPKPVEITIEDAIKVVKRAEIFQNLVLGKLQLM